MLRKHATERPGSCALLQEKRAGTFTCAGCGQALFVAERQVRERHRLAQLLRAARRMRSARPRTAAISWPAPRCIAAGAVATSDTCSPMVRPRPACGIASTAWRWSSSRLHDPATTCASRVIALSVFHHQPVGRREPRRDAARAFGGVAGVSGPRHERPGTRCQAARSLVGEGSRALVRRGAGPGLVITGRGRRNRLSHIGDQRPAVQEAVARNLRQRLHRRAACSGAVERRGEQTAPGARQRAARGIGRDPIHGLRVRRSNRRPQMGAAGPLRASGRRPASEEHLRLRDAFQRRRAAVRLLRSERRGFLLLVGRDALVEANLAAAADLPRLRYGLIAGCASGARVRPAGQRARVLPGGARREDRRRRLARAAHREEHLQSHLVMVDAAGLEELGPDRDRDDRSRIHPELRPRRQGALAGRPRLDAACVAGGCRRPAARRHRRARRRRGTPVLRNQGRRRRRHHAGRRGDQQRLRAVDARAGIRLHAVAPRASGACVSRPRRRHDAGAVGGDRQGDLSCPRRRRRPHVLGVADRYRKPHLLSR